MSTGRQMSKQEEEMTVVPIAMSDNNALVTYTNASMLKISDDEQKKLQEAVDDANVEIRPDGLIYLPQVFVRDKLNQVFGIGQWALIQHSTPKDPDSDKLYFDGSLYVRGCFAARAVGEGELHSNNPMQSWASVYESAKSDCLVRCCKDLGIAKELWMPAFGRDWQKKYAVRVWREKTGKKKDGAVGSFQWRRKDVTPFFDERGQTVEEAISQEQQPEHPHQSQPVKVHNQTVGTEFDPTKEVLTFGKFKGMKWGEAEKSYIEWLAGSATKADVKAKAEATQRFFAQVPKQKEVDVVDEMFPVNKKTGEIIGEEIKQKSAKHTEQLNSEIKIAKSRTSLIAITKKAEKLVNDGEVTDADYQVLMDAVDAKDVELKGGR